MKRSFGLGCSLLTLSGKADDAEKQPPDIWKPFMDSYNCAVRLVQEQYTRTTPTANAGSPSAVAPPQSLSSEFIEMFPPYGYLLGKEDFARIDTFIKDFVVQSLLPHMERSIQLWNKQVSRILHYTSSVIFTPLMFLFVSPSHSFSFSLDHRCSRWSN